MNVKKERQLFADAYNKAVKLQADNEFEKAYKLLVPLAEETEDANDQHILGDMYYGGLGVSRSYKKAMKWFRLSAEQGNAEAQHALGWMYEHKEGVFFRDNKEAVKWYRLSAEQGNAEGQMCLGTMYLLGRGVSKDYKEAIKWSRLAAEQGNGVALLCLGEMHELGSGVPVNFNEAVKWYRLASEKGVTEAQIKLGKMYSKGQGVEQDYVLACAWIYFARFRLDKFDQGAMKDIDRMSEEMTPEQIEKAKEIAHSWRDEEMNKRS